GYPSGGVVRFINDDPNQAERAIGTWVDPNAYGGYLLLVGVLAMTQILAKHPVTGKRWIAVALLIPIAGALALTISRGAMLAFGMAILFLAVVRYRWLLIPIAIRAALALVLPFTQAYLGHFIEGV